MEQKISRGAGGGPRVSKRRAASLKGARTKAKMKVARAANVTTVITITLDGRSIAGDIVGKMPGLLMGAKP